MKVQDAGAAAARFHAARWKDLQEKFSLIPDKGTIWCHRDSLTRREPEQGWKLHVAATILDACSLLERVAPYLISTDTSFKAPRSLDELTKINCGLQYGYTQVGKFLTIYPDCEAHALDLARELHARTLDFVTIKVPFDEQYAPESSVFYRYGSFAKIEIQLPDGSSGYAVRDPMGVLVPDDRKKAVPAWIRNPFPLTPAKTERPHETASNYQIITAISQRGKGGTYFALDGSSGEPRMCMIKEGRRNGEVGWNGQDGKFLVRNEARVLKELETKVSETPRVLQTFEISGNYYIALEHIPGASLWEQMVRRRRRYSFRQVTEIALRTALVIRSIHEAGWVWNDCKPGNLIVAKDGSIRPVDFEGSFPIVDTDPFDWVTKGFTRTGDGATTVGGGAADLYALGAVIYFLVTGKYHDQSDPIAMCRLRRNVPARLAEITNYLLTEPNARISTTVADLEGLCSRLRRPTRGSRSSSALRTAGRTEAP